MEKRRFKEKEVLKQLRSSVEQKQADARKFNQKQAQITLKMQNRHEAGDKRAFGYWRKEVKDRLAAVINSSRSQSPGKGFMSLSHSCQSLAMSKQPEIEQINRSIDDDLTIYENK